MRGAAHLDDFVRHGVFVPENEVSVACAKTRHLSNRRQGWPRPVNICMDTVAIPPLVPLIGMIIVYYETIRRLWVSVRKHGMRKKRFFWVAGVSLTSMYPTFYNHDALFMYLNDRWYELFAVQLWFTITDDACVVLRWCKSKQNLRLAFRAMHLLFNVMFEKNVFHPRNMFFCLDDAVSILYIHLHEVPALGTNRMWWTKREFWNALVIAGCIFGFTVLCAHRLS